MVLYQNVPVVGGRGGIVPTVVFATGIHAVPFHCERTLVSVLNQYWFITGFVGAVVWLVTPITAIRDIPFHIHSFEPSQ
jgi:hypothetical protein